MATQLSRTFDGYKYYCEFITAEKQAAIRRKEAAKFAGFKARIVELQSDRKKVYGVFVR